MAIEIVDFPSYKMVIFHSCLIGGLNPSENISQIGSSSQLLGKINKSKPPTSSVNVYHRVSHFLVHASHSDRNPEGQPRRICSLRFCAGVSSPKSVSRACRRNSGDGVALDIILGKRYIYMILFIVICFIILMIIMLLCLFLRLLLLLLLMMIKNHRDEIR